MQANQDPMYMKINHLHFKFPEIEDLRLETLAEQVINDKRTVGDINTEYTNWFEKCFDEHQIPQNQSAVLNVAIE